ncbi:GPN-loop GTPase 2 [Parastagonospora nodorum]|nr:GPN-loop GTPase 2 [Parastagonospora nodorum]KAH4025895.1 GPN-loop GTPase 2 [Parastagonospora nodorum]KAH4600508.1 GPN-loop GTPase 2 [Parastagonospora nodorum]KAH4672113.1 GPN-loop GTPase 2 [Parastagonospora nodorum]KAH4696797.1 GPN-loop GTPase 2 [Parastagonospora nodorum]
MPFAQLVIGPPGSGKSTYCDGMQQFMGAIERKCSVVNLDPANDSTSYQPAVDVRDLVTIDDIMEQETLGPNGGVLFALEELENHFDWLEECLKELGDDYVLFDCPGQVELFTHHGSLRNIFFRLQKIGYRLVVVHLTDSIILSRPSLYVSSLLLALRSMLQMDLPHLNVLTKIDNLKNYPNLPFNLDFYTEVQDLHYLLPHLNREQTSGIPGPTTAGANADTDMDDDEPTSKFSALNKAIVELVEDFALVGFETLAVEDKKSMMTLLRAIDRAGGYALGGVEGANETVWQMAMRSDGVTMDARDVQERWLDRREELDEEERKAWAEESKEMADPPEAQQAPPPAPKPAAPEKAQANDGDEDDDMEDLEEMRKFMEKKTDVGVNIVKK